MGIYDRDGQSQYVPLLEDLTQSGMVNCFLGHYKGMWCGCGGPEMTPISEIISGFLYTVYKILHLNLNQSSLIFPAL